MPNSVDEQKLIVDSVESLVAKIVIKHIANKKYKEQKKLMQDLLTGKMRVS